MTSQPEVLLIYQEYGNFSTISLLYQYQYQYQYQHQSIPHSTSIFVDDIRTASPWSVVKSPAIQVAQDFDQRPARLGGIFDLCEDIEVWPPATEVSNKNLRKLTYVIYVQEVL